MSLALGTLVVMNNDEGDHLRIGPARTALMLGWGGRAHMWIRKRFFFFFCKAVPWPLGVPKQVVEGYFEPSLTQIGLCIEMGNFGTDSAMQEVRRGMCVFFWGVCLSSEQSGCRKAFGQGVAEGCRGVPGAISLKQAR